MTPARFLGAASLAALVWGNGPTARADEPSSGARFGAMLDRPLFSPARRPPPPMAPPPQRSVPLPVAAAPPTPAPPPDVALSGVILGGGTGVALLRRSRDAVAIRVALGGQVEGWTVAAIRPRAIVLRRDGRDVTLELPAGAR